MHQFIAIEGNIGTGKTELARKLSNDFSRKLLLEEFEDNSFLPKFYNDHQRYAFPLELSFLASRFNQLKKDLMNLELFNNGIVSDYVFFKCLIFSKINLNDDEYTLYQKLFDIINLQIPSPDLLVYLHKPVEKLQENIRKRGREYEQNISNTYLQTLQNGYFSYLYQQTNTHILLIDTTEINFIESQEDYNFLVKKIMMKYPEGVNVVN